MKLDVLKEVYEVVQDRKTNPKPSSYVSSLIREGLEKILAKVEEESEELIEAARQDNPSEIIHEAVDLIFHVFVLLVSKNIKLEEILEEFRKRRK
ncbi:phosphoribosyl-ATP diphosphatase [Candidatus Bathyarchaeota archaeon]|nr:MAG: phosphoribosyl-ATP diphosphatase [Candidatus Bathyarchaeota archaeon]